MGITTSRTIYNPAQWALILEIRRYTLISKLVVISGVFSCPFWLSALFFTSPRDYSYLSSLVVVPLLAVICMGMVTHVSQGDPFLRWLLGAGLVAHMAFSSLCLWLGFLLYGATLDAFHYWTIGLARMQDFSVIGWSAFHPPYTSTNLINNIAGVIMLFTGDGLPALFITFALMALWGGYFFYRAFIIAFPEGDRWLFGLLVILLPSILYWSSPLGKDALAQFCIGIASYGLARYHREHNAFSAIICILGIGGMMAVRAHIAAMLAMGVVIPYAFSKTRGGPMSMVAKIFVLPLFLLGTFFLVTKAEQLVGLKNNSVAGSIEQADTLTRNTQTGGSSFNEGASLPVRIAESPFLLFRPFPWEIHNPVAAAASLESAGLLLLCWRRRRSIRSTLSHWRDPYVGFILIYVLEFSIAYAAATSNFGILVRERIMMLPFVLMLICATPKATIEASRLPMRKISSQWIPATAYKAVRTRS